MGVGVEDHVPQDSLEVILIQRALPVDRQGDVLHVPAAQVDGLLLGQGVVPVGPDVQVTADQRPPVEGGVAGPGGDGHLERSGGHIALQLGCAEIVGVQIHLGPALVEGGHQVGEQVIGQGRRPHVDDLPLLAQRPHAALELPHLVQHLPGSVVQGAALPGEDEPGPVPGEQLHAELPFQLLDRPGDGGLGDPQLSRRPGHVPVLAGRHKIPQLGQRHGSISPSSAHIGGLVCFYLSTPIPGCLFPPENFLRPAIAPSSALPRPLAPVGHLFVIRRGRAPAGMRPLHRQMPYLVRSRSSFSSRAGPAAQRKKAVAAPWTTFRGRPRAQAASTSSQVGSGWASSTEAGSMMPP